MTNKFFLYVVVVLLYASFAHAFGAGNIPSISKIEGKNFRHGDIEDTLALLAMSAGGGLLSMLKGGKKFDKMAIKRVYFGNWLRDYSQAIDISTLKQGLTSELLTAIVWILGIMEFGYGTGEFQVTEERLGTYRADEHIDNPKGYGEGEDAPKLDPRLRGPVKPVELEIDPQTGMKNYICNERGDWPTSSKYVRESIHKCIALGRQGGSENHYEALRLLGQALHTLEDFPAHSNYCELVLMEMGHQVFPHVGRNTQINLNGKQVYPLVTGTFGGLDFVHSLIGAANDSLSEVEIEDVNNHVAEAAQSNVSEKLKGYLRKLPIKLPQIPDFSGGSRDMSGTEIADMIDNYERDMQVDSRDLYGGFEAGPDYARGYTGSSRDFGDDDPNQLAGDVQKLNLQNKMKISTPDLSSIDVKKIERRIMPLLKFRDAIMYGIEKVFDTIPGLSSLADKISETMSLFVFGLLSPVVKPMIAAVTKGLHASAGKVTASDDQIEVWKNPHASDPTHSQLSKDHFSLYLNEPAGQVAAVIVQQVVPLVVNAWSDKSIDPNSVTNTMMEVMHHPAMCRTPLQQQMKETVKQWLNNLGPKRQVVLDGLSPDGVLNGANNSGGKKHDSGDHSGCSHASGNANLAGFMAGKFGQQSFTTGKSDSWQSNGGQGNGQSQSYQGGQSQSQGYQGKQNQGYQGSQSQGYYQGNQGNQGNQNQGQQNQGKQDQGRPGKQNQGYQGNQGAGGYQSGDGGYQGNQGQGSYSSNQGYGSHNQGSYSGNQGKQNQGKQNQGKPNQGYEQGQQSQGSYQHSGQSSSEYESGYNKYGSDNQHNSGQSSDYYDGSSSQSGYHGSSQQSTQHGTTGKYDSQSQYGSSGNYGSNSGKQQGHQSSEYGQSQSQGYNQGQSYNQGHNQGHNQGQSYNQGYNQGHNQGGSQGYSQNQGYGGQGYGNQGGRREMDQSYEGHNNQYYQGSQDQSYLGNQGDSSNQGYYNQDQSGQGQGYQGQAHQGQGYQGGYNQGQGYDNRY